MGDSVRPGQSIRDALTSTKVNAMLGAIRALARGDNIVGGLGIYKSATPNSVMLTSDGKARSSAREFVHPFEVVNGTESGYVQVLSDSYLYNTLSTNERLLEVENLDTDILVAGARTGIYLHGMVTEGAITRLLVDQYPNDGIAAQFDENGEQTDFWYPLAEIWEMPNPDVDTEYLTGFKLLRGSEEDTSVPDLWVYQIAFTHLRLMNVIMNGNGAVWPFPA
jgi:hypothetical protein